MALSIQFAISFSPFNHAYRFGPVVGALLAIFALILWSPKTTNSTKSKANIAGDEGIAREIGGEEEPCGWNPESGTTELDECFLELITYQGREFQNYSVENAIYFGPIDDDEIERLELQHRVLSTVFDERLIFPPVDSPKRVLDCGYGTGSWAVEVAEKYPSCEVIGVDISPHMRPDETPENLWLQVDDLNRPFTFKPNYFDVVHSRLVASGLHRQRWPSYIRDIKKTLRRGGWVQMVEIYFNVQSDNGTITHDHALRQWSSKYFQSIEDVKDPRVAMNLKGLLESAGFANIQTTLINVPLAPWPNDARLRGIGSMNRPNVYSLLGSLALYPLMKRMNMSREEFEVLVAQARTEVDNLSLKAYFPLYVAIGQKP
ncbi:uncharacterized protein BDCG_06399 [Blastomyces dermatitidis ER-3]|uniref:S-adenosyl-L-methionine-dependent methyltransferase n=1 Tax=Ajellomyces dermatitidis (strain ER-3 / ATCC MYA-2586) TaxID=559297 RepID=A0ABP2F372_AJEDR|nr:uncharacterized protein BDCG_06399 [Blastomyces dermatitidis ER-3]EEQ91279.1 hypothetical protein BDCG_06399 [Blastomyces dermatitidis ER-3]